MVLYTLIVRLSDGMPLVSGLVCFCAALSQHRQFSCIQMASTDTTPDIYKNQAKAITKKLHPKSPSRMSVESGDVTFNYVIEDGVVFLTVAEASYPRRLAFGFLADVYKSFVEELKHEFGDGCVMEW
jgi:vesicle transport protein SEC22